MGVTRLPRRPPSRRRALVAGIGALLLAATAAGTAAHATPDRGDPRRPTARTLATVSGRVYAVAQAARYVAWRTCNAIEVREVGGRRYPPLRIPPSPSTRCRELTANEGLIDRDVLVLLGGTVTWSEFGSGNSTDYVTFHTARIVDGRRVPGVLPSELWLSSQGGFAGSWIVGPARAAADIVFAHTTVHPDPSCTSDERVNFTCRLNGSGTVWRVDARLVRHRITAAPATLLASDGTRVAVVALDPAALRVRQSERRVVLRRLNGAVVSTFDLVTPPQELALSSEVGAVLGRDGGKTYLEWFGAGPAAAVQSVPVGAKAQALSIAGRRIVFREGRRILAFTPGSPRPVLLAEAARSATVIGPSLEGDRLVWAETLKVGPRVVSRIRELRVG